MIYIMCGIPGSGKTTYALHAGERLKLNVVSSDQVKQEVMVELGYEGYTHPSQIETWTHQLQKKIDKIVWKRVFGRLHYACERSIDIILDAASLQVKYIQRYKDVADKYGKDVTVWMMTTSIRESWKRNTRRDRVVPFFTWLRFVYDHLNNKRKIKKLFSVEEVA